MKINLLGGKFCTDCRQLKPLGAFSPSVLIRRGSMCRSCRSMRYEKTPLGRTTRARYMRERRARDPAFVARQKETAKAPHRRYAHRDGQVRRQYGLEPEDLARIYDTQDRKCAGCARALDLGKLTSIDHCHTTGRVRGLLCFGCNSALGGVRDSPETLWALAHYLAAEERR